MHFGFDATVVYPVRSTKTHFVNLVRQCEDVGIPILDGMPDITTAATTAAEAHDDDGDGDDGDGDDVDARGGSGTARRGRSTRYDVIVDAVFGFSFRGSAPREPHASAISAMRGMRERDDSVVLVSVDVPSGWDVDGDGDGGSSTKDRLVPDVLVSLTAPKPFAREFRGRHFVGGRFLPPALAEKYGIRVSGDGPVSPPQYNIGKAMYIMTGDEFRAPLSPLASFVVVGFGVAPNPGPALLFFLRERDYPTTPL